jgi:hypothetical protein
MKNFFNGYKTYILIGAGVLTLIARHFNYIDTNVENVLLTVEGFGTVGTLRLAIASLEDKVLGDAQAQS